MYAKPSIYPTHFYGDGDGDGYATPRTRTIFKFVHE